MLSAVENFGPLVGPAATLSHARPDNSYVTHIAGNVNAAAISSSQAPLTPTSLIQLNAFQALKLHHLQQKYEQRLSSLLPPSPSISNLTLPHRSLSTVPDANADGSSLAVSKDIKNSLQHSKQPYSTNFTWPAAVCAVEAVSPLRENVVPSIMSTNEFTPPHPKHPSQPTSIALLHGNVDQPSPINLVTNVNVPFTNNTLTLGNTSHADTSRPPSSSSSVDIENDELMSTTCLTPGQGSRLLDVDSLGKQQFSYDNNVSTAASVVAAYHFNYSQLYPSRTALFNAPVIFSSHQPHATMGPHGAPFLNSVPSHPTVSATDSNVYSAEYLQALQNAVAVGVFQTSSASAFSAASLVNTSKANKQKLVSSLPCSILGQASAEVQPPTESDVRPKNQVEVNKQKLKATKFSAGTYLNDKVKVSTADVIDADNYFKIPIGKEGSLKHRILTRPINLEKQETSKVPVMRTHNSTSNFKKGSYIELANGVFRRVEDMRTEDFIQCADRSPHHQLTESTVVKISASQLHTVVISFSYDRNRSKVDIEVPSDHPFFVYGQGWASCNPDMSFKAFGLKCQRLQVGDICISLTKRNPFNISKESYLSDLERSISHIMPQNHQNAQRSTQTSAAADSTVSNRIANSFADPNDACHYSALRNPTTELFLPSHLSAHSPYAPVAGTVVSCNANAQIIALNEPPQPISSTNNHLSPKLMGRFYQHQQNVQMFSSDRCALPAPDLESEPEEQLLLSRKRRWSAPESIPNSDDDEAAEYEPPQRLPSAGGNSSKTTEVSKTSSSGSDYDSSIFK